MRAMLDILLTNKNKDEDDLKAFVEQYRYFSEVENILKYADTSSLDNAKVAVDKILRTLKINARDTTYNNDLLLELFTDISKYIEDIENKELLNMVPTYNGKSLADEISAEGLISNLRDILEHYVSLLEDRYKNLKSPEKFVVKDFYYLKCDLIETFDGLRRCIYG